MQHESKHLVRPTLADLLKDKRARTSLFYLVFSVGGLSFAASGFVFRQAFQNTSASMLWYGILFFGVLFLPASIWSLTITYGEVRLIKSGRGADRTGTIQLANESDQAYLGALRVQRGGLKVVVKLKGESLLGVKREHRLIIAVDLVDESGSLLNTARITWAKSNSDTKFHKGYCKANITADQTVELFVRVEGEPELKYPGLQTDLQVRAFSPDAPLELHLANPVEN